MKAVLNGGFRSYVDKIVDSANIPERPVRDYSNELGVVVVDVKNAYYLCIGYKVNEKTSELKLKYINEDFDVKSATLKIDDKIGGKLEKYRYTSHMFTGIAQAIRHSGLSYWSFRQDHYRNGSIFDTDLYSYKQVLKIYYYNEQGNIVEMEYHEPARESLRRLKVGDNLIDKLPEILDKYKDYNKRRKMLVDEAVARVTVLKPRFVRAQPKTFDYVYVDLGLPSDLANTDYVKENKAKLDALVLDKLHNYDPFLKYGIPDNFLRIERITLTRDNLLEYVIGLKENVIE